MAMAVAAVALLAGAVGTAGAARAAGPALNSGWDVGSNGGSDLSGLKYLGPSKLPVAQRPVEAVPGASAAPHGQLLPNAGAGCVAGRDASPLLLLLAIAGVAGMGAAGYGWRAQAVRTLA